MKTLILGVGNPFLCDDSIGLHIARALQDKVRQKNITVIETGAAGLELLELLSGYDRAIIIDAAQTGEGSPGHVYRLVPESLNRSQNLSTLHSVDFITALKLARRIGLQLPQQIVIFAVEVKDIDTVSEECTPEVMKSISSCIGMVFRELDMDKTDNILVSGG